MRVLAWLGVLAALFTGFAGGWAVVNHSSLDLTVGTFRSAMLWIGMAFLAISVAVVFVVVSLTRPERRRLTDRAS